MTKKSDGDFDREYDRGMLRSELVSLFWAVIAERKKESGGFALKQLADALGVDKSQVSRWFNGLPNWEANTMADIAGALDVDLQFIARDRRDGRVYTAAGPSCVHSVTASSPSASSRRNSPAPEATGVQSQGRFKLSQMAA